MKTYTSNYVVGALLVGGLIGLAGAASLAPHARHRHWGKGYGQHRLMDRFSSTLHLTPEQREKVSGILEAKRQKIEALRAEIRPRFDEIRTSTSGEIRQLLTPEQQQQFDAMEAERAAKRKQFREKWGGSDERP